MQMKLTRVTELVRAEKDIHENGSSTTLYNMWTFLLTLIIP